MKFKIIPADDSFFDLFSQAAANNVKAAELVRELFSNYADRDSVRDRIGHAEHEGDEIVHQVMRLLNTTFVTPFDREDIYNLASNLDDVTDHINAAADFVVLHNITEPLPEQIRQVDVIIKTSVTALEAVQKLQTLKGLQEYWIEINRLENEGDRIFRKTVAQLFSGDYDAMEVLKHKDVIEELEEALDSLERVANTVEAIVLKHT